MADVDVQHLHEDLVSIKRDVALLKNILAERDELSDWAKKELEEAREVPDEDLIDLDSLKADLLK